VRQKKDAASPEDRKLVLKDILPHIRFPCMCVGDFSSPCVWPLIHQLLMCLCLACPVLVGGRNMSSFAATVPAAGVVSPEHLLGLFRYLGDMEKNPDADPTAEPWNCAVCTYHNEAKDKKCKMCSSDGRHKALTP
jgi:hypothetical protein